MTLDVTIADQEFFDALKDAFLSGTEQVTGAPFDPDVEASLYAKARLSEQIAIRLSRMTS